MTRAGAVVAVAASSMLLFGCTRDDESIKERLDKIDSRLASIEKGMASGGNAAAARRGRAANQRPKGPDPSAVYSVDIEGAAWEGTKDAKVTVVEAFEFA